MIQPSTEDCLKQKHHAIEEPYLRNAIYTYKFFLDCDDDRCLACPGGTDIDSSQIGSNNRCPEIFQCTNDNSCNNQGTCNRCWMQTTIFDLAQTGSFVFD